MKVYLAGKVSKNDWRHEVVPSLRGQISNDLPQVWPEVEIRPEAELCPRVTYVGPYFISCDHGCAHGDSTHGVSASNDCPGLYFYCGNEGGYRRATVKNLCTKSIESCDLFFAWLPGESDTLTAYGTLVEIGQAMGLGKRVVIGTDGSRWDDLWFVYEGVEVITATDAAAAARWAINRYGWID